MIIKYKPIILNTNVVEELWGDEPHGQETLVKCSDEGGGRDLENLGESLGKSDGLDELDKSDKLDKSDESDGRRSVVLRNLDY